MRKFQSPGLPPFLALTDRADGTVWYVTHRQSDDRWAITDTPPPPYLRSAVELHEAYGEPFLDTAEGVRFFVRSGRIGYEQLPKSLYNSGAILTRVTNARYRLRLSRGQWTGLEADAVGSRLGYTVEP